MPCAKFLVRGKVQGVFFRASTRSEALALDISGYAKNLADGSVEVLARGRETALSDLERWLKRGPPMARVDEVVRIDIVEAREEASADEPEAARFDGFFIGRA